VRIGHPLFACITRPGKVITGIGDEVTFINNRPFNNNYIVSEQPKMDEMMMYFGKITSSDHKITRKLLPS
tara:strand:+ start:1867 stop:2076 length:210 start_codon:yes stop_codon:yes gene_type:complete